MVAPTEAAPAPEQHDHVDGTRKTTSDRITHVMDGADSLADIAGASVEGAAKITRTVTHRLMNVGGHLLDGAGEIVGGTAHALGRFWKSMRRSRN